MNTNCVNCGAPINRKLNKCPYCGTPYDYSDFNASFESKNPLGTISIAEKEYQVYLGKYDVDTINMGYGRDIDGIFKEIFTEIKQGEIEPVVSGNGIENIVLEEYYCTKTKQIDLCPKCREDFERFMRNETGSRKYRV